MTQDTALYRAVLIFLAFLLPAKALVRARFI